MDRVDLHAVYPGIHAQLGCFGKCLHHLMNLRHRQGPGDTAVIPAVGGCAGAGGEVVHIQDGLHNRCKRLIVQRLDHDVVDGQRASKARRQLNEQFAAGPMELLHKRLQLLKLSRSLIQPFSQKDVANGCNTGQNQAHVVLCTLQKETRRLLIEVVRLHPSKNRRAAHRGHNNAVFNLHIADFPRGK